jgi:hypothetical protein
MLGEIYGYEFDSEFKIFEFESAGPKGIVKKVVQYTETNLHNFYNLGFGDKVTISNSIDDLVITNNGDSQKILATVAATLIVFTDRYPEAFVMATGSTAARTRLYRMGINNNLEEIENDFYIFGLKNDKWLKFQKNAAYEAFLVKRKW